MLGQKRLREKEPKQSWGLKTPIPSLPPTLPVPLKIEEKFIPPDGVEDPNGAVASHGLLPRKPTGGAGDGADTTDLGPEKTKPWDAERE